VAAVSALALLAYVAFQILPLPLSVVDLISPQRAELTAALNGVMDADRIASLTISPDRTAFHLSRLAGSVLIFFTVRSLAQRARVSRWTLLTPLVIIGTAQAVTGLFQHASGLAVTGTYSSRNFYAGFLAMLLPCAVLGGLARLAAPSRDDRYGVLAVAHVVGAWTCAVMMLAAISLALSRLAFLAALSSLALTALVLALPPLGARRRVPVAFAVALAFTAMMLLVPSAPLVSRFGQAFFDDTVGGRLPIFADTAHLFIDYPLTGIGLGSFFPGLLRYQSDLLDYTITNAHNDYLQIIAELGGLGASVAAVFVLALLTKTVREAWQASSLNQRALPVACLGGLCAVLLHSLGDFVLYVPANATAFAWIAGVASVTIGGVSTFESQRVWKPLPLFAGRVLMPLLGVTASAYATGWIFFLNGAATPERERSFCRWGICDASATRAALVARHGSVEAIPVAELATLLRRDPAGPYAWCDLGDALFREGRVQDARWSYRRAVELAPHVPFMLIRAARFHFAVGEDEEGLALTSKALATHAGWALPIFSDYDAWNVPTEHVLARGLPSHESEVAGAYLMHLASGARTADAEQVWRWMLANRLADDAVAGRYVDLLIRDGMPKAAFAAWQIYVRGWRDGYRDGNWIFSGGFETSVPGSQFSWRLAPRSGAVAYDDRIRHSGQRSLRIDFDGTANVAEIGVSQHTLLPAARYRLRAWVKTQSVSTDQGIAFRVEQPSSTRRLELRTDALLGTQDWTLLTLDFDSHSDTALTRVSLVRRPSLKFDNRVRGTIWVDDVSIMPIDERPDS
jgi:O-antigen ligase